MIGEENHGRAAAKQTFLRIAPVAIGFRVLRREILQIGEVL